VSGEGLIGIFEDELDEREVVAVCFPVNGGVGVFVSLGGPMVLPLATD